MKHSTWWWLSTAVSIFLIIVLLNLWAQMNQYTLEPTQLVNEEAVNDYLRKNLESRAGVATGNIEQAKKIKTGIFIQSLKFFNSTEVNLSGYICQRYQNGLHDDIKPGLNELGFIGPEQGKSGSEIEAYEVYRVHNADEEIS